MGDYIQMKSIITIIFTLVTLLVANSDVNWIDEQIEAIKPARKAAVISSATDPFIFLDKNKKEPQGGAKTPLANTEVSIKDKNVSKEPTFTLSMIMNQKAMINEAWYGVNDKIYKYTITEITKDSVSLKDNKKELHLTTQTTQNRLNFKNR